MDRRDTQLDTPRGVSGLIRLATIRPELEYLFRHVARPGRGLRLAAASRSARQLHGQVGEALESLYPERRDELAAVLAMHFEEAGDTERAIELPLDRRAVDALDRNAIQEAFARSIEPRSSCPRPVPTDDEATRRRRVELELGRAKASWTFRSVLEVIADLEAIVDDAERARRSRAHRRRPPAARPSPGCSPATRRPTRSSSDPSTASPRSARNSEIPRSGRCRWP